MRIRFFFLVLSAIAIGTAFGVQACSSDAATTSTPGDAGKDAADAAKDAFIPDAADDDNQQPCDTSGDFTTTLPDASALDGATTTGLCLGCLDTSCPEVLDACNKDCNCREFATAVLECFGTGKTLQTCLLTSGVQPNANTQNIGLQFFACVQGACKNACGASSLLDAGTD